MIVWGLFIVLLLVALAFVTPFVFIYVFGPFFEYYVLRYATVLIPSTVILLAWFLSRQVLARMRGQKLSAGD